MRFTPGDIIFAALGSSLVALLAAAAGLIGAIFLSEWLLSRGIWQWVFALEYGTPLVFGIAGFILAFRKIHSMMS